MYFIEELLFDWKLHLISEYECTFANTDRVHLKILQNWKFKIVDPFLTPHVCPWIKV